MGSPRCIDDKKYARNAFIFNFVFVFASSTNTTAYEPIVTKIGDTFRTCEVSLLCSFLSDVKLCLLVCFLQLESSFLSDKAHRNQLQVIMTEVFEKLNSYGLCTVNIG